MSRSRQPPSFAREVVVFLPTALLLLIVIAAFDLYLYRSAVDEIREQDLDEARAAATGAAAALARGPLPSPDRLPRLAPEASAIRVRDAGGEVLLESGEPLAIDLEALLGGSPPGAVTVLDPSRVAAPSIVAVAPFANAGRAMSVEIDLPAERLATYLGTERRILYLNLAVVGSLTLLVLLYLRRLLAPYESMLERARQLGGASGGAGDETEFLIATFERALAALDERAGGAPDDIEVLERTLAPSLESGFLLLDAEGRVLSLNPLGAELLGTEPPPPGAPLETILAPHPALAQLLDETVAHRTPIQREEVEIETGPGADGKRHRVLGLSAHPLRRDDGELRGFIVLFADLTEARVRMRRAEMARSLSQLGEIAAGVAHEMRNGLGTLKGYLTLIDHAGEGESVHDYLAEMRAESEHLERVLNDFLSFARPGTARSERFDLEAVVRRATDDPALAAGAVTLEAGSRPVPVQGDARLVERALRNLLDNAVRAHADGAVTDPVVVRLRREDDRALVEIEDRGPGIDPAIRDSLLQPFVSGRADGVGLGLALAHRIAELHGGILDVSERDGGGVRATLQLPVVIDT